MKTKILLATLLMLALPMTAQDKKKTLHAIRPEKIYEIPTMRIEEYQKLLEQLDENPTNVALNQKMDSLYALSPLYYELYGTSCSWYCGGDLKSITSSSELKPVGKLDYKASNVADFDHTTAWVEGANGTGKGEFIEYTFTGSSPQITAVKILNGYCKNQQTWEQNGRVKKLIMYNNDIPVLVLELENSRTLQCFNVADFAQPSPNAPDWKLRFEILEVYPGSKFEDTALSEIYFDGVVH